MPDEALLVSIRPQYADCIFAGSKRVELRRVRPRLEPGQEVLVYVSSPAMELRGTFTVKKVEERTPRRLWHSVKRFAGISKAEFDDYFRGATQAYAIHIDDVEEFDAPVSLTDIRARIPRFRPPQSYHYLKADAASDLIHARVADAELTH